jgi:5'-nucleotidase
MKLAYVLACLAACSSAPRHDHVPPVATKTRTLTIIGTNDLHGALERLPLFAGFVANVRAARAADGGGVLLVDAGDLFQGTLESNLGEGADVVKAYNALGYTASAIGNHEFDYGPVGPAVTAKSADEDPRGALKARVHEATFPFLETNILDDATGAPIHWPNVLPSTIVEVGGVKVGLLGASTAATPTTTMPANFVGLKMSPAAQAITEAGKALRAQGAQVVVVLAHIGSECKDVEHPDDTSTCDKTAELFHVLDEVPAGLIDVFVAGHTHAGVAHRINGIAVIESYSSGRAFGRVDLQLTAHVDSVTIHPPQLLCPLDKDNNPVPVADCHPAPYEGRPVTPDPAIQKVVDGAVARAGERRAEKLGVTLTTTLTRAYGSESAEGDLFTDLMLAARPDADVAVTNGGGLRADIPAGDLTYGGLFTAMPFDNRFAIVKITGKQLRRLVTSNLQRGGGILSWGGLTARARCKDGSLAADIEVKGKPLADAATYTVVTSDFLASGGDGLIGRLKLPDGSIQMTDAIIRDAMADVLRTRKGTLDPTQLLAKKRLDYEGKRPVACGGGKHGDAEEPD